MPSNDKPQLKDGQGNVIVSQYFDTTADDWKLGVPVRGDGADVTQGAKADTAATDDTGSWSVVALLKRLLGYAGSTIGSKAAGVAATASSLIGGVFSSTMPTLTDGQQAAVRVGQRGQLLASQPTLSSTNRNVTATTTSAQLFPASATRVRYVIQNQGAINIYIQWGGGAVIATSYKLVPGATYLGDADGELIGVIAESGTAFVYAREWG